LKQGLRAVDGFVVRRCQIILASAWGEQAQAIAHQVAV